MEVGLGPGSHLALPAAAQPAPAGLLLKDQGVSRCASQLQKLTWHPYLALGVVHGTVPLHSLTSLVCGGQNQACDDADQPTDQLTVKPTGQGLHKASSEVIHGGHQAAGSPMGTAQGRSEWLLPVLPLPREGASLRLRKSSCSCLGSPGTPRAQVCTFSPSSGTCLGPSRIESASLGGRRLSKKWGGPQTADCPGRAEHHHHQAWPSHLPLHPHPCVQLCVCPQCGDHPGAARVQLGLPECGWDCLLASCL